jgi:hypothetical protein
MVECLLSKLKALSSNPSTAKKKDVMDPIIQPAFNFEQRGVEGKNEKIFHLSQFS